MGVIFLLNSYLEFNFIIMESSTLLIMKPTLARRVSDLFKTDGSNNCSPLIFSDSSMKKFRHCCQNLGLFPYLLYSLGNSKTNDTNKHNLSLMVKRITEKIFLLYANIHQTIRYRFYVDKIYQKSICRSVGVKQITDINIESTSTAKNITTFDKFDREKAKTNSLLMKISIYIAMAILLAQLIAIFSLIFIGKFTPGFLFLVGSLLFLGYINMSVLFYQKPLSNLKKHGKRKTE